MDKQTILVVDDDTEVRSMIVDVLQDEGYLVNEAKNWQTAHTSIKSNMPDLVLLDLWIGEKEYDGIVILEKIKEKFPDIPVVMISGHGNIEVAVKAIKNGAYDFIEKPFVIERLLITATRAIEANLLKKQYLQEKNEKLGGDSPLIGKSPSMSKLRAALSRLYSSDHRILLYGQPGCEAEHIAWHIHANSARKNAPFIVVNCILSSDSKPIFHSPRSSVFRKAEHGTLFLDNIFYLSPSDQRILLEAIANKDNSNFRLICATVRADYTKFIQSDKFMKDLYTRLSNITLDLPPLNERKLDIEDLIEYFSENSKKLFNLDPVPFAQETTDILTRYPWPGNIRQLRNAIELAFFNASDNKVQPSDLPKEISRYIEGNEDENNDLLTNSHLMKKYLDKDMKDAKEEFEKDYLSYQIVRFFGNVNKMASSIGMNRSALHRKLKQLGINPSSISSGDVIIN